jgi:hypothetical protein
MLSPFAANRTSVCAACCLSLSAFILCMIAVTSASWTYSTYAAPVYGIATQLSFGPWIAGQANPSVLAYRACVGCQVNDVPSAAVYWSTVPYEQACSGDVYTNWAGPKGLNLCANPSPSPVPTYLAVPKKISSVQATSILSVILSFFAMLLTCVDSFGQPRREAVRYLGIVCAFLGMVFAITAFALWAGWGFNQTLVNGNTMVGIPLYLVANQSTLVMVVPLLSSASYGPGFGCQVAGFVCLFFVVVFLASDLASNEIEATTRREYAVPPPSSVPQNKQEEAPQQVARV